MGVLNGIIIVVEIFKEVTMNNRFFREKVVGSEVHEWDLVKTSLVFKPECKDTGFEIAASYLNAAKKLQEAIMIENHPEDGVSVLMLNSLIIPFLFLCHHSIELAIKVALSDKNITYGNIHSLRELFSMLDLDVDQEYLELMEALDFADSKGMWLRYDKDLKTNNEYLDKPIFINSKNMIDATDRFVRFLIEK